MNRKFTAYYATTVKPYLPYKITWITLLKAYLFIYLNSYVLLSTYKPESKQVGNKHGIFKIKFQTCLNKLHFSFLFSFLIQQSPWYLSSLTFFRTIFFPRIIRTAEFVTHGNIFMCLSTISRRLGTFFVFWTFGVAHATC